ncbi:MAG: hypothetical protein SchgKO_17350 [Schleiferiaceae bacterium]
MFWTLAFGFSSLDAQPSESAFSERVFNHLLHDSQKLNAMLVPLNEYLIFVDQQEYSGEEKEFYKSQAIENYPKVASHYATEVKRICDFYEQRQEIGYTFTYLTTTFLPKEDEENTGYMVIRYSSQIEDEIINDKIIFECLRIEEHWYILDGFFEDVPED